VPGYEEAAARSQHFITLSTLREIPEGNRARREASPPPTPNPAAAPMIAGYYRGLVRHSAT
jgi:hypothetical protein